jgi:hypothetical protein
MPGASPLGRGHVNVALAPSAVRVILRGSMAHLAPHQEPWFHDLFDGPPSEKPLSEALADVARPRVKWLRRCVALVSVDNGYWREERLVEGLDGSLVLEIDSHRGDAPHREPMPAERAKDYDALVAMLRRAARTWPAAAGVHREPGSAKAEMVVVLDAATLEGRALIGESTMKAFRGLVFPGLDVATVRRSSGF